MRCPVCGSTEDQVVNTREPEDASFVRRRRRCRKCGARFTTYERIEQHVLMVVKRDGRREAFDRAKIERGLRSACQKRPIRSADIDRLIADVTLELERRGGAEVSSEAIGTLIMDRLRKLDGVAYLRFASVYWAFEEPAQFVDEVRKIARKLRRE